MSTCPPRSFAKYTITSSQASGGANLSFANIELFPVAQASLQSQLKITRTRNGSTTTLSYVAALGPADSYTIDTANSEVDIQASDLQVNDTILIRRQVESCSRLVDFTSGSILDETDLDKDSNQLFFLIQEALDGLNSDSLGPTNPDDPDSCWNGLGREACNFAPASAGSSLTTLAQVQGLITGLDPAEINESNTWVFSGTGSQTDFTLSGIESEVEAGLLFVAVDGVLQTPDEPSTPYSYTVDNTGTNPVLQFNVAPAVGTDNISIRLIKGVFLAEFGDASVDGDAIIDGSIDESKLGFASGAANRYIKVDATGDVLLEVLDHDDVSDFDAGVQENTLDSLAAASGNVDLGSNKLVNVGTPTASSDAATKGYVDTAAAFSPGTVSQPSLTPSAATSWQTPSGSSNTFVILSWSKGVDGGNQNIVDIRNASDTEYTIMDNQSSGDAGLVSISFVLGANWDWRIRPNPVISNTYQDFKVTYISI